MWKFLIKRVFLLVLASLPLTSFAELSLMLESGAAWQHRNDLRIPGKTGTRLDFDKFDQGPFFHYRAEMKWSLSGKHNLRAVYAPLNIVVDGVAKRNVDFDNQTFASHEELEVDYTFNSYRLGYFYSFLGTGETQFNLGLTGKIRDAEIKLTQAGQSASYDNVGFVPLIYVEYQTPLGQDWLFNFNADGAAASQGRAFDLAFKFRRKISTQSSIGLGVRSLEGGADNEKVYTFSWLNYAVVDFVTHF